MAKKFKSWTGLGDYKISYNSLIHGSNDMSQIYATTDGRGFKVKYREYLGDVAVHPTTVGAFNIAKFSVNPGDAVTFPWLTSIANQFDQYVPMGVIFEFKTTTTDSTTNSAIGSLMFCSNYDVSDPAPANKQEMLNTAYANETKMSEDTLHGLECDPAELQRKVFYTRGTGSKYANNNDSSDYDLCNTYIATQGGSLLANTLIGSLYVTYEFMFLKQKIWGGLPNKGMLWTAFGNVNNAAANILAGSQPNIANLARSTPGGFTNYTAGLDLGITHTNNHTITFPQRLAGALIRQTIYFDSSTTETQASAVTTQADYVNCSQFTAKNWGDVALTTAFTDCGCGAGAGVVIARIIWENFIQIATPLPSTGATLIYKSGTPPYLSPLPATLVSNGRSTVVYEVLPSSYFDIS